MSNGRSRVRPTLPTSNADFAQCDRPRDAACWTSFLETYFADPRCVEADCGFLGEWGHTGWLEYSPTRLCKGHMEREAINSDDGVEWGRACQVHEAYCRVKRCRGERPTARTVLRPITREDISPELWEVEDMGELLCNVDGVAGVLEERKQQLRVRLPMIPSSDASLSGGVFVDSNTAELVFRGLADNGGLGEGALVNYDLPFRQLFLATRHKARSMAGVAAGEVLSEILSGTILPADPVPRRTVREEHQGRHGGASHALVIYDSLSTNSADSLPTVQCDDTPKTVKHLTFVLIRLSKAGKANDEQQRARAQAGAAAPHIDKATEFLAVVGSLKSQSSGERVVAAWLGAIRARTKDAAPGSHVRLVVPSLCRLLRVWDSRPRLFTELTELAKTRSIRFTVCVCVPDAAVKDVMRVPFDQIADKASLVAGLAKLSTAPSYAIQLYSFRFHGMTALLRSCLFAAAREGLRHQFFFAFIAKHSAYSREPRQNVQRVFIARTSPATAVGDPRLSASDDAGHFGIHLQQAWNIAVHNVAGVPAIDSLLFTGSKGSSKWADSNVANFLLQRPKGRPFVAEVISVDRLGRWDMSDWKVLLNSLPDNVKILVYGLARSSFDNLIRYAKDSVNLKQGDRPTDEAMQLFFPGEGEACKSIRVKLAGLADWNVWAKRPKMDHPGLLAQEPMVFQPTILTKTNIDFFADEIQLHRDFRPLRSLVSHFGAADSPVTHIDFLDRVPRGDETGFRYLFRVPTRLLTPRPAPRPAAPARQYKRRRLDQQRDESIQLMQQHITLSWLAAVDRETGGATTPAMLPYFKRLHVTKSGKEVDLDYLTAALSGVKYMAISDQLAEGSVARPGRPINLWSPTPRGLRVLQKIKDKQVEDLKGAVNQVADDKIKDDDDDDEVGTKIDAAYDRLEDKHKAIVEILGL